nr:MAG TPA_asm: hypothetical protein [Caudoviricetes sp.]
MRSSGKSLKASNFISSVDTLWTLLKAYKC